MAATERAAPSATTPPRWSVVWPTPAVVALGIAVVALPFGLGGVEAAWLLFVVIMLALCMSPLLARAEVRRSSCAGPQRRALDAGNMRLVALECQGRARDVLVRVGAPERLARAHWAAVTSGLDGMATVLAELRVARRGRWPSLALEVASTFPFGLCEVRERRTLQCEAIVRPRPLAPGPWLRAALAAEVGHASGAMRDPAGEFQALVEWRPGEPLRRLHAGASLRRGRAVRIEATSAGAGTVTLILATASGANAAAFERSVSAATRVVIALERSGRRLALRILDGREGVALGARAALDALADVARAPVTRTLAELLGDVARAARAGSPTLFCVGVPAADGEAMPAGVAPGVTVIACEATGAPYLVGGAKARRRAQVSSVGPVGRGSTAARSRDERSTIVAAGLRGGARPR